MNDKEAFDKWLKDNFSKLIDQGNNGGLAKMNDDLTQCWLAACEYKNKEYSDIADARMQTSFNNVKLQAENAKLRECVEKVAYSYDRPTDMMNSARQVLKELEDK